MLVLCLPARGWQDRSSHRLNPGLFIDKPAVRFLITRFCHASRQFCNGMPFRLAVGETDGLEAHTLVSRGSDEAAASDTAMPPQAAPKSILPSRLSFFLGQLSLPFFVGVVLEERFGLLEQTGMEIPASRAQVSMQRLGLRHGCVAAERLGFPVH